MVTWGRLPLVPVTVTDGVSPEGVDADVATVRTEVLVPLMEVGLKLPEAPAGRPLMPRLMTPLNPGLDRLDTV